MKSVAFLLSFLFLLSSLSCVAASADGESSDSVNLLRRSLSSSRICGPYLECPRAYTCKESKCVSNTPKCPKASSKRIDYKSMDFEVCKVIRFTCPTGSKAFSKEGCGCGCKKKRSKSHKKNKKTKAKKNKSKNKKVKKSKKANKKKKKHTKKNKSKKSKKSKKHSTKKCKTKKCRMKVAVKKFCKKQICKGKEATSHCRKTCRKSVLKSLRERNKASKKQPKKKASSY
mmetsp:Transcript_13889/g.20008  ORF Transcript_13889/g.20008 Transcript_13889/m.20008 type:complete len:229 (-) Transcript_13889:123-809(-)|eukprot:CAMPEP_0202452040 /NCGR_PEP_ID=MMETSP1360-20130828/10322_1 /ASSEMBLY_ACC=CAM_ASM_000848 /TAXON_ID=515479 /ORGANISM="Licmophora paradoxa, Strain CCMP2313" /LENGTH=228 /DNA_ID=CAMNT_0049070751 /DNA_START=186 /DNA_END=872 /DNA_ORIENTATION=+